MWSRVRTWLLVLIFSTLIWLWAEAESLTTTLVSTRIEIDAGTTALLPRLADPGWSGAVTLKLEGSTAALGAAERALPNPVRLVPGFAGVPGTPGEYTLDLATVLQASAGLRNAGISIVELQPPQARIVIDELVTRDLPVRLELSDLAGSIEGEPELGAARATVRLPASAAAALDAAAGAAPPQVRGVLDPDAVAQLSDQGPQALQARLLPPDGLPAGSGPVTITPPTVSVTLRVRSKAATWTIPTVPVWVAMPAAEAGAADGAPDAVGPPSPGVRPSRWRVDVPEPFLTGVTVRGPREDIDRMRREGVVPVAYVLLSTDDLESGVESKRVTFSTVPTSLTFDVPSPVVRLRIVRLDDAR